MRPLRDGGWRRVASGRDGQYAGKHSGSDSHDGSGPAVRGLACPRYSAWRNLAEDAVRRSIACRGTRVCVHCRSKDYALHERARQVYEDRRFMESPLHPMTLMLRLSAAKVGGAHRLGGSTVSAPFF